MTSITYADSVHDDIPGPLFVCIYCRSKSGLYICRVTANTPVGPIGRARPRRRGLGVALVLAAVLVLAVPSLPLFADGSDSILGENSGSVFNGDLGRVYSLLDYFESGRQAVQVFVANAPRRLTEPRLGRTIDNASRVCVRVEVRFAQEKASIPPIFVSGVLVDRGRRVLTAGHVIADLPPRHEILITLPSGETRQARRLEQERGDSGQGWAVLEIIGSGFRDSPDVDLGDARAGDVAIILGYPEQIGINAAGSVAFPTGKRGEPLSPLTTLGMIEQGDEITLVPQAGAIPTSGMDGAPVFDSRGRLLGVIVAIARKAGQGQPEYTFHVAPASSVKRQLKH